jgi:hypothetical protein
MSQGAVFKLVLRDERFDRFFTASDYLRQRFDAIRVKREAAGEKNVQPTFVDIEKSHILYIHAAYRPYVSVASEYARVKPSGDGTASIGPSGGTIDFTFPIYGHFTSDMAIHVKFKPLGSQTLQAAGATPTASAPLFRYCAYPGIRLIRRAELRSDQVLIDDYDRDDVIHHMKSFVNADQRIGWDRCMGQQAQRQGAFYANGFTGVLNFFDGPQTPALFQDTLELLIPLQFWLGQDASQALLNDLIPNSQRTITCELAPISEIVEALLPDPNTMGEFLSTPLPFTKLGMEVSLYVNGLYVNPEIHDVFASRIGFSLIRVHRRQLNQIQNHSDAFLLDQLKFPAEFLMVGIRDRANLKDFDNWWLMGAPAVRAPTSALVVPAMIFNQQLQLCQLVCRNVKELWTLETVTDTVGVTAHGIDIFPMLPNLFHNAYMPTRYAKNSVVVSPYDQGELLVNFCLYPGKFNPSGYYNLSAGRELYINYELKPHLAEVQSGQFEMTISMSALNFLMRKGDKVHLRYAL